MAKYKTGWEVICNSCKACEQEWLKLEHKYSLKLEQLPLVDLEMEDQQQYQVNLLTPQPEVGHVVMSYQSKKRLKNLNESEPVPWLVTLLGLVQELWTVWEWTLWGF